MGEGCNKHQKKDLQEKPSEGSGHRREMKMYKGIPKGKSNQKRKAPRDYKNGL